MKHDEEHLQSEIFIHFVSNPKLLSGIDSDINVHRTMVCEIGIMEVVHLVFYEIQVVLEFYGPFVLHLVLKEKNFNLTDCKIEFIEFLDKCKNRFPSVTVFYYHWTECLNSSSPILHSVGKHLKDSCDIHRVINIELKMNLHKIIYMKMKC